MALSNYKQKRSFTKTPEPTGGNPLHELVYQGTKEPVGEMIAPMLCTLVKEPFTSDQWLFEIKWDGYRLVSHVVKSSVRMLSRSGLDYTARYPLLTKALKDLKHQVVLDGEAVVFNEQGKPDFDALQLYNGKSTPIVYCAFDILWLDGYNLMNLPLYRRKQILQQLLEGNDTIRYSQHYDDDGRALYEEIKARNLEGIVGKKKNSVYSPGERSTDWVKIPTRKRQEFVIGGWSESDKARSFRSLLFGAYNQRGQLEWIGRSGGGYKEKDMPGILKQLQALEIESSPFVNKVLDTKGAITHWVKPQLVANFEFATWTRSGRIRKPATFLGFRQDKQPTDVVREVPDEIAGTELAVAIDENQTAAGPPEKKKIRKKYLNEESNWKLIEQQPVGHRGGFTLGDCTIEVTDIDREIWKDIPKAALIQYYHHVSDTILPYLKDRPQSLHIKPVNAGAPGFYVKDMEGRQPDCAEIFTDKRKHTAKEKRSIIEYLVCNNEATLLYIINLGCIDINPWSARTMQPDNPDYISIDLDPGDADFNKAIETAKAAKQLFDEHRLKSFIKTSGKTGIHTYLPCSGFNFQTARIIAENISKAIHELVPDITTTSVSINSRGDRLFVDPSQNDYADTLAAPYSVRPFHTPTVSTPLEWKEVKKRLDPNAFTIYTIEKRLASKGDLWQDLLAPKIVAGNNKRLRDWL